MNTISHFTDVASSTIAELKPFYGLLSRESSTDNQSTKRQLTAGGFDEMSYVTRLIPATSLVIREDIRLSTSGEKMYLHFPILKQSTGDFGNKARK